MSGKPYTCDHCGGTFEGRDDAEANVEAKELGNNILDESEWGGVQC